MTIHVISVAVITRLVRMVRWEPGARERLQAAALDLYAKRGFEQTTAADIAQSVGLTERTFFRYFTDKREVIFDGQNRFQKAFVDGVAAAPADASALDTVAFALNAGASFFPNERRPYSQLRQTIIVANPGLLERESLKMAWLSDALAEALRARGIPEPQASLAAQTAVTVFTVSFREWLTQGEERSLAAIEAEILADLRALTSVA
jgi:AcrR family transcriptional regulator